MTLLKNDPLTQLAFSIYENKGVFSILLGSGISRSAEIPTGWEITLDLIRRIATAQGVSECNDWAKWYREKTSKEPNYSDLLEEIAKSPQERRSILHSYIEPTAQEREEGKKIPTKAHHAIADLVRNGYIRVIITTNFDHLMENALREAGVEPTIVYSKDSLKGAEPLTHSSCYLLKLHGDYKDSRTLNTDKELSNYPREYNKVLDRILDEHGLIVSGWSGEWDFALRNALLRSPNRRYPVYWTTIGKIGEGAMALSNHRGANLITILNADDFFSSLHQRIETLEKSHRQNPQSVTLILNSTKRYLSKPEFRIQLHELMFQEASRLLDGLESTSLDSEVEFSPQEFQLRVSQYEAISESLSKMAGVLGRWGDGSELSIIADIIRSISHQSQKTKSGNSVWLNLRSYPAVLIFTAYSLGLTKSQRWYDLHHYFISDLSNEAQDSTKIVSNLFLDAWEGGGNDLWQKLEGLNNRKTALADHLLEILSKWKDSFIGIEPNFELLFERFETLASLANFESHDVAELEQLAQNESKGIITWMPMGRVGWHRETQKIILNDLEKEITVISLLEARFAAGQKRVLELFIRNFKHYASRMLWQ